MRAEHLRQWLIAATWDDSLDSTNWQNIVDIVQAEFRDETLSEKCTQKTVILIPKGKGDFRDI